MADNIAKPFLKWVGGKTQLINDIEKALPKDILRNKFTYIEPFVGSGAVLFWILNNFPKPLLARASCSCFCELINLHGHELEARASEIIY